MKDYRKLAITLGLMNCGLYVVFSDFRYYINNFSDMPFFLDLIGLYFFGVAWGTSWGVVFMPNVARNDPEAEETVRSVFSCFGVARGIALRVMAGFVFLFLSGLHGYWFYDAFYGG